jgi:hypothetical protein
MCALYKEKGMRVANTSEWMNNIAPKSFVKWWQRVGCIVRMKEDGHSQTFRGTISLFFHM